MLITKISLMLFGDDFSPKKLLPNLKGEYIISNMNEKSIKIDDNNSEFDHGFLSILNPKQIALNHDQHYENWFGDFLGINHQNILEAGVDDIRLFTDVFYTKQCNFEIFSKETLKKLTEFNIAIPISVYSVTNDEIASILIDGGYSQKAINEMNIEEN